MSCLIFPKGGFRPIRALLDFEELDICLLTKFVVCHRISILRTLTSEKEAGYGYVILFLLIVKRRVGGYLASKGWKVSRRIRFFASFF